MTRVRPLELHFADPPAEGAPAVTPNTEPKCLERLWEKISYAFCPKQALKRITATHFNPTPQVTPRAWSELYDAYENLELGVMIQMTSSDPNPQREVILFQPIAIREIDGSITQFTPAQINDLVAGILKAHGDKGVPLGWFDVLVRKTPLMVDRSQVDDTGKNTAEAIQGGVALDQSDKLALFGYQSEKTAYSFQLVPSDGRSQATGFNSNRMQAVLTNPQELVKFINPVKLTTNLTRLSKKDWTDPQKIGEAFLAALWDGKTSGWQAAIGSMGRMEGYCSQLFMENYDEVNDSFDLDATAQVATHEGLTCHFLNLLDEYGSGEYTAQVREYRQKLGEELDTLEADLKNVMPDNDAFQVTRYLAATGITPAVFKFLNDLSLRTIVELMLTSIEQAIADPSLNISSATRATLGVVAKNIIQPNLDKIPASTLIDIPDILDAEIVEAFTRFKMTNVAFSTQDLRRQLVRYVKPVVSAEEWARYQEELVAVEGGLQERYGTYHYDYRAPDGGTIATNAKNSDSARAPLSPFALAVLAQMRDGVPYAKRLGQGPVS